MQLFIPNAETNDAPKELAALGLADLAPGVAGFVMNGPGEQHGLMCVWTLPKLPHDLKQVHELRWIPSIEMPGRPAGAYHVGLPEVLLPKTLARDFQFPGLVVEIKGNKWNIPVPRMMPTMLLFGAGGELVAEQSKELNGLLLDMQFSEQCGTYLELLKSDNPVVDLVELRDFVLRALSVNYRMLPEVANHFQLIDENSAKRVMFAALGATRTGAAG